jgi:hypothetical protein
MDDQPLEGGGRGSGGGGGKSAGRPLDAEFYVPAGGAALVTAGMAALGAKNDAKREREAAAEMKRESRGTGMSSKEQQMVQEADDAKMQTKKDKAYNAAKTYPENFSKGGTASVRGDGIAQRGKTRGRVC